MDQAGGELEPGWHQDPTGRFEYRFFNGESWTADVSTGGERRVDVPSGAPSRKDGRATAAMVLGIVGLTLSWVPVLFVAGGICALLGLIFGIAARRAHRDSRGFATVGVITGGAGLAMLAVGVITTRAVVDAVDRFENPPAHEAQITSCAVSGTTLLVAGTLENLGSRSSDYRVVIEMPGRFLQPQRSVFDLDGVEPGVVAEFSGEFEVGNSSTDRTCEVIDVTGPLPFGINPGRR